MYVFSFPRRSLLKSFKLQLHFNDPHAYNDIYVNGNRFTKDPKTYLALHQDESSLCMVDLREIKTRRDVINPLFSRRAILKLEHVITRKIEALISKLLPYETLGKPVDLRRAYRSATLDIITSYCFAREYSIIEAPDFRHKMILDYELSLPLFHVLRHFPFLLTALVFVDQIKSLFKPKGVGVLGDGHTRMQKTIDELVERPELLDNEEHETIFHHLLTPPKGQSEIPSKKSLMEEALNLTVAGSDTVGTAATVGSVYILSDPAALAKLVAELEDAWPDKDSPMPLETLEKLPYLTAVVKESLRLSHGVVFPAARVVAPSDAIIAGFAVPAGSVVAMGSTFIHYNPEIFPDPHAFRPERWLQSEQTAAGLEQYLVSFSKGPRSCIGVNLAWAEMYMLLGHVFRKVDMELYNTTVDDLAFKCHFTPTYRGRMIQCLVKART
ncbi:cytochrome P450 [Amylostereum chailletii]|nr:cytochrome P450 [Amylostereum chailletii]